MERRTIRLGSYDTAATGDWTLAAWSLSPAVHHTNYISVPGRDGVLDFSTALTDGTPTYDSRTLSATLDRSSGSRLEREDVINTMINWLDGWRVDIVLPDDPDHYLTGRVSVRREFNDLARARVTVSAVCDPWRYARDETVLALTASDTVKVAELINNGRRTAVPVVTITGAAGSSVLLEFGSSAWSLGPGTYQLPDLVLPQGAHSLTYSGAGSVQLAYREAIL